MMQIRHFIPDYSTKSSVMLSRRGISLVEVIFATGVLLIGLMGLAAVLPVATNNARRSLESDRSKEVFLNQDANRALRGLQDVSLLDSYFKGENSLTTFTAKKQAFLSPPSGTLPGEPPSVFPTINVVGVSDLPPVFCIDPWFLTAANTLRDDTTSDGVIYPGCNGYDRSLFPCYDQAYDPTQSPSNELIRNPAWSGRRMPRISISSVTSVAYNEVMAKDFDAIRVVLNPDDKSLPSALFVKRANDGLTRTSTSLAGNYSYLMTMRRNGTGNVVVFKDRQVVIDPAGDFGLNDVLQRQVPPESKATETPRHKLTPYDAATFAEINQSIDRQTFSDERLGWVTYAKNVLRGSGGSFEFKTSAYVDPNVAPGDWVMLLRRNYSYSSAGPVEKDLAFAWCQVSSVDEPAVLEGSYYRARITVQDVSWIFHPLQTYNRFSGSGPYRPNTPPKGWDPASEVYDGDGNGEYRYGTLVVLMKNIVTVRSF